MKHLTNPKWLIAINTLPICVLSFLLWGQFSIFKSLLNAESLFVWKQFAIGLAVVSGFNLLYALVCVLLKKPLNVVYAFLSLLVHIGYIYLACLYSEELIPRDIPQWMISTEPLLYLFTFLMPSLVYALFVGVVLLTPNKEENRFWFNVFLSIGVPVSWYVCMLLIPSMLRNIFSDISIHVILVIVISGTLLFLFYLIRAIYILSYSSAQKWRVHPLLWKIPITLIFPLLGLTFNNNGFGFGFGFDMLFGDFSSFWFYALCIINGVLLCIPNSHQPAMRLLQLVGRSITSAYTLYFFIVFLPFLPLSVLAILAIGIGFLLLAPLLLFVIHCKSLADDYQFLQQSINKRFLVAIMISGFLVIPIAITVYNLHHKRVLDNALDYVYHPDYSRNNYAIDTTSLRSTLNFIQENKSRRRNFMQKSVQTPYLSNYFNYLVLDNLILSNQKINEMQGVFFGDYVYSATQQESNTFATTIWLSDIQFTSTYDTAKGYWVSQIDIELTNSSSFNQQEYFTNLQLPTGCWISDYYLYVGDRKEKGLLIEKKAAEWVYAQIRNENRDPGLLTYISNQSVDFRVFPFASNEVRRTGFELVHKEPITFTIDQRTLALGSESAEESSAPSLINHSVEGPIVSYLSPSKKEQLPVVARKPYYVFVVDMSAKNQGRARAALQINKILDANIIDDSDALIYCTNTYTEVIKMTPNWQQDLLQKEFRGGFYFDRAVKQILLENYLAKTARYPVIIAITSEESQLLIENSFADLQCLFPENGFFYSTNIGEQYLKVHDMTIADAIIPELDLSDKMTAYPFDRNHSPKVRQYENNNELFFVPDDQKASIVLHQAHFDLEQSIQFPKNSKQADLNKWTSGLELEAQWLSQLLYPYQAKTNWQAAVRMSYDTQIMTHQTAYIAVENDAQKAMLLKKQQEVLSGNKALDLEDTAQMSEPSLWILLGLLLLWKWRSILRLLNFK